MKISKINDDDFFFLLAQNEFIDYSNGFNWGKIKGTSEKERSSFFFLKMLIRLDFEKYKKKRNFIKGFLVIKKTKCIKIIFFLIISLFKKKYFHIPNFFLELFSNHLE